MPDMFKEPIYVIRVDAKEKLMDTIAVIRILHDILGRDSIDRIVSIEGENTRVFVVAFWRVPLVNDFHNEYTDAGDTLHGKTLPWMMEQLDPYGIFKDGNFPAPHFLRNSKNLRDAELDDLGIGGPGEFIYSQLPTKQGMPHFWEMYRDGKHYMPDMAFYDKPRLEPLAAVNRPDRLPGSPIFSKSFADVHHREPEFQRWRDFYLEHPKTWPKDLTEDERVMLVEEFERMIPDASLWTPECGRDPTNMAEEDERLQREKAADDLLPKRAHAERVHTYDEIDKCFVCEPDDFDHMGPARQTSDFNVVYLTKEEKELARGFLRKPALTRQVSVPVDPGLPKRPTTTWGVYPAEVRGYWVDNKYVPAKYTWNYRKFD